MHDPLAHTRKTPSTTTKVRAGYEFHRGDIQWTPTSTIKYPCICVVAGLFAGTFGVGGGIVKGPLMLEMGVGPQVAAASAACMILYTSAAASAAYYVFGYVGGDRPSIVRIGLLSERDPHTHLIHTQHV